MSQQGLKQLEKMMLNYEPEKLSLVETKVLYLSTKSSSGILLNGQKKSYSQFNIGNYIDFENDYTIDYVTISVPYAIITNSNYNINSTNDRLDVYYDSSYFSWYFTHGNYTYQSFMTAFKTLGGVNFNITFNSLTNKFTITNTTYTFSILGTSTMDYIIGISGDEASSTISAPYSLTCSRVCNFLPNPVYNVCCDSIYNGQVVSAQTSTSFSNVLCAIPNVSKLNTQIVYQNAEEEFVLKRTNQNTLILSILDDNGKFIDFNGVASFFSLRFKIHKKIPKIQGNFYDFVGKASKIRNIIQNEEEE